MIEDFSRLGPISILLLEDSDLDADLTTLRLKRAGIEVHIDRVDRRDSFTEALARQSYDIILADYALPDFDGLAALEIARAAAPETPFILVSGVLGEEFAIDALHRGATDYVLKPRLDRLPNSLVRAITEARNSAERRRSEQALRHSQELARRIVESSRDCVMILQTTGELSSVNAYGRALLELAEDESEEGRLFFSFWNPECLEPAKAAFETALAKGAGSFEAVSTSRSGQTRYWDVLVTPVLDTAGEPEQLVSTARDISDRKRAEVERQELLAREREARSVAEVRTEELQQSLDDLQHFAYAASHDLREPLRVIALYSQLVQKRCWRRLDEDSQKGLLYIEEGARRLEALLSDIQRYSRVVNADREFRPCDMGAVVEEAKRNCAVFIGETSARIDHNLLPVVCGNHDQLVQVMQNLIENALKYRSTEPPRVAVAAEDASESGAWQFRVEDNGIGFDPQYAERIFGIFKRLHGHEYPGTGMGLAICRRIIWRHGGRIWAESQPGGGSTFFFTMPLAT